MGQGRQGRYCKSRLGVRADVPEIPLFVGKELEFFDSRPYAYEGSNVLRKSSMGFADIMKGFFAGVIAPEPTFQSRKRGI